MIASTSKRPASPKYRRKDCNGMYLEMKERLEQYLSITKQSKKGGSKVFFKTLFFFLLYGCTYAGIVSGLFNGTGTFICAVAFGISNVLLIFNIGHDASHNALFRSKRINHLLSYTFNLVGANYYTWNIMHNELHHGYINVTDYDADLQQQAPFIRIAASQERSWYHKYQVYYAPFLYTLYSLFIVFQKDFQDMGLFERKNSYLLIGRKHKPAVWIELVAWKLIYCTITIVIPYVVLPVTLMQFIAGYIAVHMIMSLFLAMVLIPVHLVDEAEFPLEKNGYINNSWVLHVMQTTLDFSTNSRFACWILGGLNTHVAHHLFPTVASVHCYELTKIIRSVATEHEAVYQNVSMSDAMQSHLRLLRRMGNAEEAATVTGLTARKKLIA
jgi:linoleoyl-CoA desaturase